MTEDIG